MSLLAFLYILRGEGIKVSFKEWKDLYNLLKAGYIKNLSDLYFYGRYVLVKTEKLYDAYDRAYLQFMNNGGNVNQRVSELIEFFDEIFEEINESNSEEITLDEIIKRFNERFYNQKNKHIGGGKHIGQKGFNPFGSYGAQRDGIRMGGDKFNNRAFYVASMRSFKNLREDVLIDTRNISIALKKLRSFRYDDTEEEIDIDETIDKTAKNFGEIEIVLKKARKNEVKLLLLIDNGGSMEPYIDIVEKFFSSAKDLRYFKDFRYFYFHNCIYDFIYEDIENLKKIPTYKLVKEFDPSWKVILVGDALMAPYELFNSYQFVYFLERKGKSGYEWFNIIKKHFKNSVWLNPVPAIQWQHQTLKAIAKIFPMFPLSIDGLDRAVKELLKK